MRAAGESSLSEQRERLRMQLQEQRQRMDRELGQTRLAPAARAFPRSTTMRLLLDQPTLLLRFLTLIIGARLAGSVKTVLGLVQVFQAGRARQRHPAIAAPRDPS